MVPYHAFVSNGGAAKFIDLVALTSSSLATWLPEGEQIADPRCSPGPDDVIRHVEELEERARRSPSLVAAK